MEIKEASYECYERKCQFYQVYDIFYGWPVGQKKVIETDEVRVCTSPHYCKLQCKPSSTSSKFKRFLKNYMEEREKERKYRVILEKPVVFRDSDTGETIVALPYRNKPKRKIRTLIYSYKQKRYVNLPRAYVLPPKPIHELILKRYSKYNQQYCECQYMTFKIGRGRYRAEIIYKWRFGLMAPSSSLPQFTKIPKAAGTNVLDEFDFEV